ncbi:MAG: hypothetical protein N2558_02145 [Patescibacteria group bacterium]|nr:hypothetical protein [Patescibacteria group bacterium]
MSNPERIILHENLTRGGRWDGSPTGRKIECDSCQYMYKVYRRSEDGSLRKVYDICVWGRYWEVLIGDNPKQNCHLLSQKRPGNPCFNGNPPTAKWVQEQFDF